MYKNIIEPGFKLVIKTVDTTSVIVLKHKKETVGIDMKRVNDGNDDSKKVKRRRRTKAEVAQDCQKEFCKKQKQELEKIEAQLEKNKETETSSPINSNKSCDQDDLRDIREKVKSLEGLVNEKKRPQIYFVTTDQKSKDEICQRLEDSKINYESIVLENESCRESQEIKIKEKECEIPVKFQPVKVELKDETKPKMLRKFRPPVSKHRQAALDSTVVKIEDNTQDSIVGVAQHDSETSIESCFAGPSSREKDFQGHIDTQEPINLSKLHQINAWFAKTQKSWCVKHRSALSKMLMKNSLIATFKCMATYCSYTTIDAQNFKNHLIIHKYQQISAPQLFFCPYCFFRADSESSNAESSDPISKLIDHYTSYHNNDKYQCGLCFYRSADEQSTWEHLDECHSRDRKLIYETPLNKKLVDERRLNRLSANIQALKCSSE